MNLFLRILNPKIVVSDDNIELIRIFYTVIIPKNSVISFHFFDRRKTIGTPLELDLDSNQIEIRSFLGSSIGRLIYELDLYTFSYLNQICHRKSIRGADAIRQFLDILNKKGYPVQDALYNFELLIHLDIPKQFTLTSSTLEQKVVFLKYSVIGIIFIPLFIVFLSRLTSTPLLWILYGLSPFALIFLIGFSYNLIGYIYLILKK